MRSLFIFDPKHKNLFGIVDVEQILPPFVFLAGGLLLRHLGANHLAPARDFLGAVGAGGAVLNRIEIVAQFHDFLVLDRRAAAIANFLAGSESCCKDNDYSYQKNPSHCLTHNFAQN